MLYLFCNQHWFKSHVHWLTVHGNNQLLGVFTILGMWHRNMIMPCIHEIWIIIGIMKATLSSSFFIFCNKVRLVNASYSCDNFVQLKKRVFCAQGAWVVAPPPLCAAPRRHFVLIPNPGFVNVRIFEALKAKNNQNMGPTCDSVGHQFDLLQINQIISTQRCCADG